MSGEKARHTSIMPTANPQTIAQSKSFMEIVSSLAEITDDVAEKIPEGAYLDMMNHLGALNHASYQGNQVRDAVAEMNQQLQYYRHAFHELQRYIAQLNEHQITGDAKRRARMKARADRRNLTEEHKLNRGDGKWLMCPKCDCVVSKDYYQGTRWINTHLATEKCRKIQIAKKCAMMRQSLQSKWQKLMLIVDNNLILHQIRTHQVLDNTFVNFRASTTTRPTMKAVYSHTTGNDDIINITNNPTTEIIDENVKYTMSVKNVADFLEIKFRVLDIWRK